MKKKTIVIGASDKPNRYSYTAVNRLRANGHQVVPLGNRTGKIDDIEIVTDWQAIEEVDTITLYLNPQRQKAYYDYIISLNPRRVIFNPGTENPEFINLLKSKGILVEVACTLVMLATGDY